MIKCELCGAVKKTGYYSVEGFVLNKNKKDAYHVFCAPCAKMTTAILVKLGDAMKQIWYFTFGGNTENEGLCQPILASNYGTARGAMFAMYGNKWAFQYSEDEWDAIKHDKDRCWPMEKELPTIIQEDVEE